MSLLLADAYIVTMDDEGAEYDGGWALVADGRIDSVGAGERPQADETVSLGGAVVTPGLVNTHHHLYQTLTRARAQQADLFTWLRELYPVWAGIDAESEYAAARTGLAELALSGCSTVFDHHYVFPRGQSGIFEALVEAARELGIRFQPCRGSMSLGRSAGGLPPDDVVEDHDAILADSERLVAAYHDPSPGSLCRVSIAPCSPFSVTRELMRDSAALARRHGLRLHTHLAETIDEEDFCLEKFGKRPVELLEELGVWNAAAIPRGTRPLDYLAQLADAPRALIIHGNYLKEDEIAVLARRAGTMSLVYCPRTHAAFGHPPHPFREFLARGARVAVGTDSLASNPDLDVLAEIRFLHRPHPVVPGATLLRTATLSGCLLSPSDASNDPPHFFSAVFLALPHRRDRATHLVDVDLALRPRR